MEAGSLVHQPGLLQVIRLPCRCQQGFLVVLAVHQQALDFALGTGS